MSNAEHGVARSTRNSAPWQPARERSPSAPDRDGRDGLAECPRSPEARYFDRRARPPCNSRSWIRRLNQEGEGLGLSVRLQGLDGLEAHIDRSSNRVALALVTLGLYIAGSLLMQHSLGPRLYGEVPALAAVAYGLALWFTAVRPRFAASPDQAGSEDFRRPCDLSFSVRHALLLCSAS